jgi:uncharacterized protein (DUF885 family)
VKPTRRELALGAGAAALAACGPKPAPPPMAFDGLMEDFARQIVADSPELATTAGLGGDLAGAGFAARLDDRSALALDLRRSGALRRLALLDGLPAKAIKPAQAESFAVVRRHAAQSADAARFDFGQFSAFAGPAPFVLNALDSAFATLPDFLSAQHTIASLADAETYIARLDQVGRAIDAETGRARTDANAGVVAPSFVLDAAARGLASYLQTPPAASPYYTALRDGLAALYPPPAPDQTSPAPARVGQLLAQAERIIANAILPAYRRQYETVAALRARATDSAGVWALKDGEAYYASALAWHTTTSLSAAQIHDQGVKRVAEISAQLDIQLRALGQMQGTPGERMAMLSADPRFLYEQSDAGKAQALADLRGHLASINARLPNWFSRQPKAALDIAPVPAFAEAGQTGAYYQPPSFDGKQPGVFSVNLRDMRELPMLDMLTLVAHEGAPGHHFQIALAQEQTALPLLRRLMSFTAYAEGWALYAEQLTDEMGCYESDPWSRLGYLRWRLWRAARLVVDTGLHALQWTRAQAVQYLRDVTGDAPGTIESEVDRYCVWPGQACAYDLGHAEIVAMRESARRRLGAKFDIKGFHDTVLSGGDMPLDVLAQRVARWTPAPARS